MNKQGRLIKGKVVGGIEWTKTVLSDGTEQQGYTWNPIAGCHHACQWTMPDGSVANCYAEDIANGVASAAYPNGFEAHYWYPDRLDEPAKVKTPSKIFVGSMADVFGHWVSQDQVEQILAVCRDTSQHTYQFLTKNPLRYGLFDLPSNVWLGASTPPDFMWGKPLKLSQQTRMLRATLRIFEGLGALTWLSAEPLSYDITSIIQPYSYAIDWIVIGAASNGRIKYPPNREHVQNLVEFCDSHSIPVFMKGNLKSLAWARENWREDFPNES